MDRTEGPEGPRSTTTKKHRLKGKWTGQRDQRDLEVQQQRSTGLKGKWTGQRGPEGPRSTTTKMHRLQGEMDRTGGTRGT